MTIYNRLSDNSVVYKSIITGGILPPVIRWGQTMPGTMPGQICLKNKSLVTYLITRLCDCERAWA
jgi:hypothetical protein